MTDTDRSRRNLTLDEQAGEWLVRQQSDGYTETEREAFTRWLAISHEHREAYARIEALWQGLDRFRADSFPVLDSLKESRRFPGSRTYATAGSLATAFMILLAIYFQICPWSGRNNYSTQMGQRLDVTLADGSAVRLNTDTVIRAELTASARRIRLLHGEALFTVTHDAERPFEVITSSGTIQDIGTRFAVRLDKEQTRVVVLEGEVDLRNEANAHARLQRDQAASLNHSSQITRIAHPDVSALTAWQDGKLVFDMTPMHDVAKELSRYHAVRFVFDDTRIQGLQVSGSFRSDDLSLFLRTLETVYPIRAVFADASTVRFAPKSRP